jgi:pilus assembly protein Flp/PilA
MSSWYRFVKRLLESEDGPTAVEYAVMLALIIVVCILAITTIGTNASKVYTNVALNSAMNPGSSSSSGS